MRILFTVLLLIGCLFSGASYGQVCFSQGGISFGGHHGLGSCDAGAHQSGPGRTIDGGQCGECLDIELAEGKDAQRTAQSNGQGRTIPEPALLAILFHVVSLPAIKAEVARCETATQLVIGQGHLSPLSTVVLRI